MFKQIFGSAGSAFTGACCLGFAPFLAGLSAIGAGFLVNDLILIPLFVVFLGFTLWVLRGSRKKHGNTGPFYLGLGGAITAVAALWFLTPLSYGGLAAVVAASVWDIVALRQCAQACETA